MLMEMKARTPRSPQRSRSVSRETPRTASSETRRSSREAEELHEVFESVARYFALLAEPMRLRILHAICSEERSVSAIVTATGATQTNVSRHLALMYQAGVVSRRREGSTVLYRLLDPEFAQICRTMCVRVAGRIEADEPLKQELLDYAAAR
jgi:DNA-binding transcriptional ArsR family regulator